MEEKQRPRRFYEKYGEAYSLILPGLAVTGELTGGKKHTNLRVQGTVEGDVRVSGVVNVDEDGHCTGNLHAACILVSGRVDGELHASEKIELGETALINGDIEAPHLAVAAGCRFNGSVRSGNARRHDFVERRRKKSEKS